MIATANYSREAPLPLPVTIPGHRPAPRLPRNEAIALGSRIVENLASRLLWRGQNSRIERDDLVQEGMAEMLRTIQRDPPASGFPLDKRIARNCKTVMLRFIQSDLREARYRQRGSEKAIRDTDTGRPAGDGVEDDDGLGWEDGAIVGDNNPDVGGVAPARIARSVKSWDFPNTDEFVYRGWLRGSVSVARDQYGYYFKPVYGRDTYSRVVADCLVCALCSFVRRPAPRPPVPVSYSEEYEWLFSAERDAWGVIRRAASSVTCSHLEKIS